MIGDAHVWGYYHNEELAALIVTTFVVDKLARIKNLFVYSLTGFGIMLTRGMWRNALTTLAKFADGNSCNAILAYTANKNIAKYVEQFGGNADFTLLELPNIPKII